MLHQYSGGRQSVAGHDAMAAASTFSLFFPLPVGGQCAAPDAEEAACYSYDDHGSTVTTGTGTGTSDPSSPASSSSAGSIVDCTLSLGTPSSRSRRADPKPMMRGAAPRLCPSVSAGAATMSCWDAAAAESCYYQQRGKPTTSAAACRGAAAGHVDQLLADRRCANCGTSSTPLWRNGPRGPKSLCNACGIRFKKEARRAAESGGGAPAQQRAPRAVAVSTTYGEEAFHPRGRAERRLAAWRLSVVPPVPVPALAFSAWPPERAGLFQHN